MYRLLKFHFEFWAFSLTQAQHETQWISSISTETHSFHSTQRLKCINQIHIIFFHKKTQYFFVEFLSTFFLNTPGVRMKIDDLTLNVLNCFGLLYGSEKVEVKKICMKFKSISIGIASIMKLQSFFLTTSIFFGISNVCSRTFTTFIAVFSHFYMKDFNIEWYCDSRRSIIISSSSSRISYSMLIRWFICEYMSNV
jgi:hypothetical protein